MRFTSTTPGQEYGGYQQLSLTGTAVRWTSFSCGNSCYLTGCVADVRRPLRYGCGDDEVVERKPQHPPPPIETKRDITATARAG